MSPNWLGDPDLVLWSIVLVTAWQFAGYSMAIFLAGLVSIPVEIVEAASVDGAGSWQRFRHVTLPLLAPAMTINLVLSMIAGLKLFDQVWAMTGGGPGHASETLSTTIYRSAFLFGDFAYATALAVVLAVFVALVSAVQYRALRARAYDR
jgi:raffinose/stachyose/melibiose transport system permease protein